MYPSSDAPKNTDYNKRQKYRGGILRTIIFLLKSHKQHFYTKGTNAACLPCVVVDWAGQCIARSTGQNTNRYLYCLFPIRTLHQPIDHLTSTTAGYQIPSNVTVLSQQPCALPTSCRRPSPETMTMPSHSGSEISRISSRAWFCRSETHRII